MQILGDKVKDYCMVQGRSYTMDSKLYINHTLSTIEGEFEGGYISFSLATDYDTSNHATFIKIYIDDTHHKYKLKKGQSNIKIDVTPAKHTFKLIKLSESKRNFLAVKEICAEKFVKVTNTRTLNLEFIGDSITTGYGILSRRKNGKYNSKHQEPTYSFPYRVAEKLNANYNVIASSGHGIGKTKDADVSMIKLYENIDLYTNTDKWNENNYQPQIDIVELGINDFIFFQTLSGEQYENAVAKFEKDYIKFLKSLLAKKRKIVLVYGFFGFKNLKESIKNMYDKLGSRDVYLVETPNIGDIDDLHAWHPGRRSNNITTKRLLKTINEILN